MNQQDIDALEAAGLKPIIIDEDTDIAVELESNTQFINRIMNYGCPTGALVQPFVIQALGHYARLVEEWEPTEVEKNGFIDPIAWKATAEWLKSELKKKYG